MLLSAGGSQEELSPGKDWLRFDTGNPVVDPSLVRGPIHMAGSSTVFPAVEYTALLFRDKGYSDNVTIDSIGSGGGFRRYITGSTDLVTASRRITRRELDQAEAAGREPVSFQIGIDAVTVTVHPANTWAKRVTMDELRAIFIAENWDEVNSRWPNDTVAKFVPGTDSGTFDFFVDSVFEGDATSLLESRNLQLSEDDNILVRGVQDSYYSVGFFGYSYYLQSRDSLKVLEIDGFGPEKAETGEYPLSRPLYVYSDRRSLQNDSALVAWILFLLNHADEAMTATGYFPAPAEEIEGGRRLVLEIIGESR